MASFVVEQLDGQLMVTIGLENRSPAGPSGGLEIASYFEPLVPGELWVNFDERRKPIGLTLHIDAAKASTRDYLHVHPQLTALFGADEFKTVQRELEQLVSAVRMLPGLLSAA